MMPGCLPSWEVVGRYERRWPGMHVAASATAATESPTDIQPPSQVHQLPAAGLFLRFLLQIRPSTPPAAGILTQTWQCFTTADGGGGDDERLSPHSPICLLSFDSLVSNCI